MMSIMVPEIALHWKNKTLLGHWVMAILAQLSCWAVMVLMPGHSRSIIVSGDMSIIAGLAALVGHGSSSTVSLLHWLWSMLVFACVQHQPGAHIGLIGSLQCLMCHVALYSFPLDYTLDIFIHTAPISSIARAGGAKYCRCLNTLDLPLPIAVAAQNGSDGEGEELLTQHIVAPVIPSPLGGPAPILPFSYASSLCLRCSSGNMFYSGWLQI